MAAVFAFGYHETTDWARYRGFRKTNDLSRSELFNQSAGLLPKLKTFLPEQPTHNAAHPSEVLAVWRQRYGNVTGSNALLVGNITSDLVGLMPRYRQPRRLGKVRRR